MSDLAEWLEAYRSQVLELDDLVAAVISRGACSEEEHRIELAWLTRMREDGTIDPGVANELQRRLRQVQSNAPAAAADEDATKVKPPLAASSDGDALTVVQKNPDGEPVDDGATVFQRYSSAAPPTSGDREAQRPSGGDEKVVVGMLLKGRFLLERELGRGGMGVVYLARDERKVEARDRDPYVAVKVLNDEFRRHPDSLVALQREASRAQQLGHENIVRVYDFDRDGDIVFMTMEYVAGTDLRSVIREHAMHGLDFQQAWPLIEGMARGLQCAHDHGTVHSDFKPGNVMVSRAGVPKIFDFGIARASKFAGDHAGEQTVFDAGVLNALTPAYASPEMTQGKPPGPSDDIYALGCVIFELLGGRHPFGKLSGEAAMRERMRPPPLPGLNKRQYKVLSDCVAFDGARRPRSALALIMGLRRRRLRERLVAYLFGGVLLVMLLAGGGWALTGYLQQRRVDAVVARLEPASATRFRDERQVLQALDALDDELRKRVVLDHSEQLQAFLLGRLGVYWDPAVGRQDYAGVQQVWRLRGRLKLFSPMLDSRRVAIERQRNDLLNTLDTRLSAAIQSGTIFEDQPGNAVEILNSIRMLDPASALLNDSELELKYEVAIGQSLDAQRFDQARQRLALARRLFPQATRLQVYQDKLSQQDALRFSAISATAAVVTPEDARRTLAELAAAPRPSSEWQAKVAQAMSALQTDSTTPREQLQASIDGLVNGIAAAVAKVTSPMDVQPALTQVATGLRYAPQSAQLLAQQARLQALQQQQQHELDQEAVGAELASRIESVRRAAAANDVVKAQEAFDRIKVLRPDDPFLTTEGPPLLSGAYLGQARLRMQQGHWQESLALTNKALRSVGRRSELRAAAERYSLAQALLAASGPRQRLDDAGYQRLLRRYQTTKRVDPDGLGQLQDDMRAGGLLPQRTLDNLLEQLQASVVVSLVGHSPVPPKANGLATPLGLDPCGAVLLAGSGRRCADTLSDESRGPDLVVIPGTHDQPAFAMTRDLIRVDEFNRFCTATHRCTAFNDVPVAPVRQVYPSQARMYASWLTRMTGYTYRLPTAVEWNYAALAGGSCSDAAVNGRRANAWGVQGLTGRYGQWVSDGRHTAVAGGRESICPQTPSTNDQGAPRSDVGFRLIRSLQ